MLTAFQGPAIIDREVDGALRRTADAHGVRYGDLLNVVVSFQLQRVPGIPDPHELGELTGLKDAEAREVLVALHADGWITTTGAEPTLHPPHTEPEDGVGIAAPRSQLAKFERAWVAMGGDAVGEFGCRRLHASLSKAGPFVAPADWKFLMTAFRTLYPDAGLGAFLKATVDAVLPMRQCALALQDTAEVNIEDVHDRARKLGGEWTRSATSRSAADPWHFLFAALRGVRPVDIARSPHFLNDAIEAALCRHRSVRNERLGEVALRYHGDKQ